MVFMPFYLILNFRLRKKAKCKAKTELSGWKRLSVLYGYVFHTIMNFVSQKTPPLITYDENFQLRIPHMLVNCTEINSFWVKIISWWNHQSGDGYLVMN